MIKHIFFDMDDTAFDTHLYMLCYLLDWGICLGQDVYITPQNGHEPFVELLNDGKFMYEADMRPHFIELVSQLVAKGYSVGVCTHRGYHEKGERYTRKALERHLHLFDYIDCLNAVHHPDKLAYLDEKYGAGTYILVDDNPVAGLRDNFTAVGSAKTLPNNVLLFDKAWNSHVNHPHRIDTFRPKTFMKRLQNMITTS